MFPYFDQKHKLCVLRKEKVGNDQEIARSERNFHSKNRCGKNLINNQVLILKRYK